MTAHNNEMTATPRHSVPTKFYTAAWVISVLLGMGSWFSAGYFVTVVKNYELLWVSLAGFILSIGLMCAFRWKIESRIAEEPSLQNK